MSLHDNFTKTSGKDPLSRILDSATGDLQAQIQNSVSDLFTGGLMKAGISLPTGNGLAARFADSFKQGVLDVYFRQASSAVERVLEEEIFDNIFPNYRSETVSTILDRIATNAEDITINNFSDASNLLQYPSHVGKYYMAMKFRCYTRTAPQAPARLDFRNAIVLPVPKNLSENFGMKITTDQTDIFGFIMDSIQAADAAERSGADFDFMQSLENNVGAAGYLLATTAARGSSNRFLSEQNIGLIGQAARAIPNPHLATFFQGVEMRSYGFDWTFAPRNKQESEELQRIIKQLKRNSLPTFSNSGTAALTYPDLCFIDMYPWADGSEDELLKFKPALLRNVSVNYAPNGIPSFFAGTNLPTFVQLKLEFVETEYFTGEDYGAERRDDAISGAVESFTGLTNSLFGGDTSNQPAENIQSPSNINEATEPETVVQGRISEITAENRVDANMPPDTNSDDNVIGTVQLNGNPYEVGIGRASDTVNGTTITTDRSLTGSINVGPGEYYITYTSPDTSRAGARGPFTTLTEASDDLVNGPLPVIDR